jgi:cobalamin biosynthesis Mg chelatase CobN
MAEGAGADLLGHRQHAHRRRRHRPGIGADRRKAGLGRHSGRVTGFEILKLSDLGRPRVDVTLRVSGFFRDAFPDQIDLFDSAVRAVGALDEPEQATTRSPRACAPRPPRLAAGRGREAARRAGYRVFGSKPGAYGAGLQALIDEGSGTSAATSPTPS